MKVRSISLKSECVYKYMYMHGTCVVSHLALWFAFGYNNYYTLLSNLCRCEYYKGNKMLPVFSKSATREHYSIETLTKLILDIDSSVAKGKCQVCSTQPVQVCHNASFLVDLHSLADAMDIRADENGVWDRKGSPVTYVSIHRNGSTTTVYKRSKLGSHSHHYKVTRVYYQDSSSPDFTRIITTVNGKGNYLLFMYHACTLVCVCEREIASGKPIEGLLFVYQQIIRVNCNTWHLCSMHLTAKNIPLISSHMGM